MRIILSIFFLFLSINSFSQNQSIENKYLVTNNNFGKINSKTTIDDLFSIFGKDNEGVFVEGIGRPKKNGIDFEFSYYEKDVAKKIKLYLIK